MGIASLGFMVALACWSEHMGRFTLGFCLCQRGQTTKTYNSGIISQRKKYTSILGVQYCSLFARYFCGN